MGYLRLRDVSPCTASTRVDALVTGDSAPTAMSWRHEHPEPDEPLSLVERARVKELEDEAARLRMANKFLKEQRRFRRMPS
jgi:hypothetical protein